MQAAEWSQNAAYRDSAYAHASAHCTGAGGTAGAQVKTAVADGADYWVHVVCYYYQYAATYLAGREMIKASNSGGASSFLLLGATGSGTNSNPHCILYVYNTAGASASVNITPTNNARHTFDFHVYQDGANARVDMYIAGALATSVSVAGTSRGFESLYLGAKNAHSTSFSSYSELIISTTDTRGLRAKTLLPASNGIYSEWEGDYTAVDEPAAPDGLGVVSAAPDQRISFGMAELAAGTNVGQVFVNVLGSAAAGNDVAGGLRLSGADYYGSNMDLSSGMLPGNSSFLVNPATGSPFTAEELNAAEVILKSVEV